MKIKFVAKPKKVMKDYIALNWLEPELAKEFGIRKGEFRAPQFEQLPGGGFQFFLNPPLL